jgi:multisubunit Na+/H+ antiporter MnhE subunit
MRLLHAITFAILYLWQVILSTWRLTVLTLSPKPRIAPCFVDVPLDLRGEFPCFLFACLISMTPGSLSVALDRERQVLVVHLLDAPDPAAAVSEMKAVFEQPLLRIFGRSA